MEIQPFTVRLPRSAIETIGIRNLGLLAIALLGSGYMLFIDGSAHHVLYWLVLLPFLPLLAAWKRMGISIPYLMAAFGIPLLLCTIKLSVLANYQLLPGIMPFGTALAISYGLPALWVWWQVRQVPHGESLMQWRLLLTLLVGSCSFFYVITMLTAVNCLLDPMRTNVICKAQVYQKCPPYGSYTLSLGYTHDGKRGGMLLEVPEAVYQRLGEGDTITLRLHPGYLGWPWHHDYLGLQTGKMIATLDILQRAIDKVTGQADGDSLAKAAQEVLSLCENISAEALSAYRQYHNVDMAQLAFRQFHRQLNMLYDIVHLSPMAQERGQLEGVAAQLRHLIKVQEDLHFPHIDPLASLPLHYRQELHEKVGAQLPPMLVELSSKGIAPYYISEIRSAMDSLLHPDKLPDMVYHHRWYIPRLLGALGALASDKRQKDWPQRFMQLMVNYNFNHMGFFNRWREQQDGLLEQALLATASGAYFRDCKRRLSHFRPLAMLAYDPLNDALLAHMGRYVDGQKRSLKQMRQEAELAQPSACLTSLNSHELSVDFHYKYKVGFYPYATKREAAKAYAQAHRSKTGQYITPHSLEKRDLKELEAPALKMRRTFLEIVRQIEEDFKPKRR